MQHVMYTCTYSKQYVYIIIILFEVKVMIGNFFIETNIFEFTCRVHAGNMGQQVIWDTWSKSCRDRRPVTGDRCEHHNVVHMNCIRKYIVVRASDAEISLRKLLKTKKVGKTYGIFLPWCKIWYFTECDGERVFEGVTSIVLYI